MALQGALWLAKRLSLNLNFSFLNRIRYFSYQVATQSSSRGWVDPVPDPILPEKFLGYSRGIAPGTSWMAVRRANHYTKQAVKPHINYIKKQKRTVVQIKNIYSPHTDIC